MTCSSEGLPEAQLAGFTFVSGRNTRKTGSGRVSGRASETVSSTFLMLCRQENPGMINAELTGLESESHCEFTVWSGSHNRTEMRRDGHTLIEAGEVCF